jgi:microcystin-dependent protein
MFAGNFAPQGWAFCDGQLIAISENDVLFALIGTTYGGDGQSTFALPDLRGRIPVHTGAGHVFGEAAGSETVALAPTQIPAHSHSLQASGNVVSAGAGPTAAMGSSTTAFFYGDGSDSLTMSPAAIGNTGGNLPHNNMAPFLGINFIISLFGVFPSQN